MYADLMRVAELGGGPLAESTRPPVLTRRRSEYEIALEHRPRSDIEHGRSKKKKDYASGKQTVFKLHRV